ncbi:MAG: CDP-diacylglycerol--serine O-phosphatidyltransferase [Dysgonamonadaceae bacterium]|nr:CDP-diacylglycerol--serine O-phosphatidyltransferase [Dysgonamonadaceae bacterium]
MKNVPNMITCLNLLSGCMACVMALNGNPLGAFIFIIMAAVFDFLDGFAARLLNAYSNLGKELDSLADVVSFGVAPGMMIYVFLQKALLDNYPAYASVALLAFLIPIFSALRLAKFNVDERQTSSFIGLPVPANALFWGSLIYTLPGVDIFPQYKIIGVALGIFLFSYLMVSEIPMFSLKPKNYGWKGNESRYILIATAIALFAIFNLSGISLTIVIYILMSLLAKK